MGYIDCSKIEKTDIPLMLQKYKENENAIDTIYMDSKDINVLPTQITLFSHSLKHLSIGYNNLKEIPQCVFSCQHLESLDVNNNIIKQIPKQITQLKRLEKLCISNNILDGCGIDSLPCLGLVYLDLSGNQLTTIPKSLLRSKSLQILDLSRNKIETLSEINAIQLQLLNVAGNKLRTIPRISNASSLELLNLSENSIKMISENSFDGLYSLKSLFLNTNPITSLPDMSDLLCIKLLDISKTKIVKLHHSIASLAHLQELRLVDPLPTHSLYEPLHDPTQYTHFQYPPAEVCSKGLSEILAFLKASGPVGGMSADTTKSIGSTTLFETRKFNSTVESTYSESVGHVSIDDTNSEHQLLPSTITNNSNYKMSVCSSTNAKTNYSDSIGDISVEDSSSDHQPLLPSSNPNYKTKTSKYISNTNWNNSLEHLSKVLQSNDDLEIQKAYQELMFPFFDSIHLHIVSAFFSTMNQGTRSSLSLLLFKIDSFLLPFSSFAITDCIKIQALESLIQFMESVIMNVLFVRTNLLSDFSVLQKSLQSFYGWLQGIIPGRRIIFGSLHKMIGIFLVCKKVTTLKDLQVLKNEMKHAISGQSVLNPFQVLKWIQIVMAQFPENASWFDEFKSEYQYYSRKKRNIFRNVQHLQPLRWT